MVDKNSGKPASPTQASFNAAASGRTAQPKTAEPKVMSPRPSGVNGPKPPGSVQKAVDSQVFAQQAAKLRASQQAKGVDVQPKARTTTSAAFNAASGPKPLSPPSGRGRSR